MNLADLLRRNDRSVDRVAGAVEPFDAKLKMARHRAVRFEVGTRLILRDAHEFSTLKTFPTDIGWTLLPVDDAQGGLRISLIDAPGDRPEVLFDRAVGRAEERVVLNWPISAARSGFSLLLEQTGKYPTVVSIGGLLDPRAKIRSFIKGRGVEVGPGLNPLILPAKNVHVEYVEQTAPAEWRDLYGKGKPATDTLTDDIIRLYKVGSAVNLAEWDESSLDFIFSNHVLEHLVNPVQVLENWMQRLRLGGVIAGALPDARYTFDLRQPFSTASEFRAEYAQGGFSISDEKYDRWCKHTAPYNTPEDLRARQYSIHVHYYSPDVFRILSDEVRSIGYDHDVFLDTAPNNKDFGFALIKK